MRIAKMDYKGSTGGLGTVLRYVGLAAVLLLASSFAAGQVSVTTQHNDLARTGQNLSETALTPANVNVTQFGLLFRFSVDNQVYAEPLVVANVSIGGGTHNVVYAATTNNSVYAFDADTGAQYWHVNLGTPISNVNYSAGCPDINGDAGIVGSPVIDPVAGTLYVVNSLNSSGVFSFMLHALDITTGTDKAGSPVQITATGFSALLQNQRAALVLTGGNLLVPFSSHCDIGKYHGFLFAYNPSTLAQVALFNASPTTSQNSLWLGGNGPSVDSSGNIYFTTSNGHWDGVSNFSESFIKLNSSLMLADWFTAANWQTLDQGDLDLATSGPLLIPPGNRLFAVGKSKTGYVINSSNMGHLGDASAVQTITLPGALYGGPVYWNGAANGPEVYVWAWGDALRAFKFDGNVLTQFQTGPVVLSGFPGAFLAISANGNANGVIWANGTNGDAGHSTAPGIFRAYDASNITKELWNSSQNATRDTCTNFSKYGYPTVANGKVYLPSFGTATAGSGQVCVYGLLSGATCNPPAAPSGLSATALSSSQINLSWTAGASNCPATYNVFRSTTSGFTPSSSNQIAGGVVSTSYSDTGLLASTTYYYLVETVNSAGASAPSNQASATTPASTGGGSLLIGINAGGLAVSPFVADEDFVGGGTISHANTINLSGVTNPAPVAVYQTARTGNFTYTVPGFTAGSSQTVRLHFAETFFNSSGSRVFNVSINGTQVLTNFDIIVAAGAMNKAVIAQFTENANSSGQYVIQFTSVVNNSLVSGIEIDGTTSSNCTIVPTAPSGLAATAVSSSEVDLSWTASTAGSGCTITYTVTRNSAQAASGVSGTSFKDTGLACNTAFTYTVAAVDGAGSSGASNSASATTSTCPTGPQINSGGPAVSPFVADVDFTGGSTINHANTIDLTGVTNPAPMAVYQTARIGNFTYTIPGFTAGSSHLVRLHFAETYFSASGSRTFNVSINGTQVLAAFDIFATAGAKNKAVIEQFTENANSSGQYVIQFTPVKDNSLVSGIEIQ